MPTPQLNLNAPNRNQRAGRRWPRIHRHRWALRERPVSRPDGWRRSRAAGPDRGRRRAFRWEHVMSGLSRETSPPCCTLTLALVALLALAPLKAGAQVAEDTEVSPSTWWLTLGVGPTSGEVATLLSLTTAYRPGRAGSLRLIEASPFDPMGPGTGMELREVSLTWHLGESLDAVWYSIGAGAGVAWGSVPCGASACWKARWAPAPGSRSRARSSSGRMAALAAVWSPSVTWGTEPRSGGWSLLSESVASGSTLALRPTR